MPKRLIIFFTCLIAIVLSGCASTLNNSTTAPTELLAEVLHSSLLCGTDIQQPLVSWIDDQADLEQRYAQFNTQSSDPVFAPALDFVQSGALLIAMGPQPSTGYLLNYIPGQDNTWLAGSTLVVSVDWVTPDADSMQAQVITSPCLLLRLDKLNFKRLKVLDQDGEIKLESAYSG